MTDYFITMAGKEYPLSLEATDSQTELSVSAFDNQETVSFYSGIGVSQFHLHRGHQLIPVKIETLNDSLQIEIEGYLVEVQIQTALQKRVASLTGGRKKNTARIIKSEMPGTVKRVQVQVGQEVKAGDSLLVLEAMKMENQIKAVVDGKVKAVHVEAGAQVAIQAVLITFE